MKIASVVLRARPERLAGVRARVATIPGVEVQAADYGRLVLTIEDIDGHLTADALARLHRIEGVIGLSLAYEYCDDVIEGGIPQ
ncbi:MAG: chaperone NapD [Burkholderiales bacterium]|nr:chaperone NapD [Burkholderiales bacterium]